MSLGDALDETPVYSQGSMHTRIPAKGQFSIACARRMFLESGNKLENLKETQKAVKRTYETLHRQ